MSPPRSRRRWILYTLVAVAFAGGAWYFGFRAEPVRRSGSGFGWRNSTQAVPVRAVPARQQNLEIHLRAIGTVMPLNTVTVRSRVEGMLLRVHFQEGQAVQPGQLLAEIDPLPYEIRLTQARAQLRQNEAQLKTARGDLERVKQLHAQTLVTQQQLEAQQSLVAEREAAVAADQAQVADAERQLAYTRIEAPIGGRVGLRQIDAGNLIRPGDPNGLIVITQTRPIAVTFTIPENELHKVVDPMRAGEQLRVEAWDRAENRLLASGMLKTVDNQIDLATGTLRLKAEFPNADERLFPNQFVNVRLHVGTLRDAVVVPSAAVQFGSRGTYVYVVTDEMKAVVRDVVLGASEGAHQAITKGLRPGEQVVLEGLDRLRDGRAVILTDDTQGATATAAADGTAAKSSSDTPRKRKKGAGT